MKTNDQTNACPQCGETIPGDAPRGLCPRCVLANTVPVTESGQSAAGEIPSLGEVGAAFPQLEILELIGTGGMGAVYKARQPKLDRFVALKVLPPSLAASPAFAERFNREARVLARLGHPGIVSVFDFGQAGDYFFLLMEFVDGVNLRQAMQAGRFTPTQALALVPKICEALQFAHDEGILHRDIKPENILLDTKGRVKIADFGIAKLLAEPRPVTKLTATGAAIGTPQYMAPEQIEHPEDVDQRADIYSLGVVFYEMLTGELPIGRFAPPSEKSPVDPRVDAVVFRTLEKERERRYSSAGEVKTSVEHLTSTAPTTPPAHAPAFDPAKDFILCPPQLPRMAQAIIVYTLTVAPLLWLFNLFIIEPLPDHPLVGFVQVVVNVLIYGLDFLLAILIAIGGWKLRGFRASAINWLRTTIWLRIGCGGLAILGVIWVELLAAQWIPEAPVTRTPLGEGVIMALALAAMVFEISTLVWLHRHGLALRALCESCQVASASRARVADTPPTSNWSWKSIIGAALVAVSLPLPVLLGVAAALRMGGMGQAEMLILIGLALLLGLPGTILGWMGLSDLREHAGRMRGLPFAVFAALAWPLGLLAGGALVLPAVVMVEAPAEGASPWRPSLLLLMVPAGVLTFSVWAVDAAARWGANRPLSTRRGVLKWIFLVLVLALVGLALSRPTTPATSRRPAPSLHVQGEAESSGTRDERAVILTVAAPPREYLIVSATVLSNRVPIAQPNLRTRLWPPSTTGTTDFQVKWEPVVTQGSSSWDIEVTSPHDGQILARLCPNNLPQFQWSGVPVTPKSINASHEAREMEIARALRRLPQGTEDWSLRLKVQSQPPPPTESRRGIEADVVVPTNQVALFEVVTRSNGVVVPVPGLAAYVVNATPEPWKGKFIWADDPNELDPLTASRRWSFGLQREGDRSLQTGLGVVVPPARYTGFLGLYAELKPDHEELHGQLDSASPGPAYGLRVRTQTVLPKPGLRYQASGSGTNWVKEAASR